MWESNCSGKLSLRFQPDRYFRVLVLCSAATKDCRLTDAYSLSRTAESQAVREIHRRSAPLSGMDPGCHSGGEPGGVSKILSIKDSSTVQRLTLPRCRHAVPLRSPATKSTS